MDVTKYDFPKLNAVDMAFSTIQTDKKLLEEAKKRGFYGGNTEYNALFGQLFFNGGDLNFKKDLDKKFADGAIPYLKSFMGSFEPKHEEKEAISSLLLSELVDIN